MKENFKNLNLFLDKHHLKKNSFINFLQESKFIKIEGKNTIISLSKFIIVKDNKNIFLDTVYFYRYINNNDIFTDIVINDNYNIPIYDYEDKIIRRKKVLEASTKRLLFLDFEFVSNQYYEVAFEVYENGKRIKKGYFFEEKALNNNYITNKGKFNKISKINIKTKVLNEDKKTEEYKVIKREKINYILEDIIENIDYLVVHNCNSELSILKENNIILDKSKCICTANLFKYDLQLKKKNGDYKEQLSLIDLVEFFDIKTDVSKLHFAYYDVEMLKKVFFKIVEFYYEDLN